MDKKITIVSEVPAEVFGCAAWPMYDGPWAKVRCKRYGKRFQVQWGNSGYRRWVVYTPMGEIHYTPWFDKMSGKMIGYRREIVRKGE